MLELLIAVACDSLTCGPGTQEYEGECVAVGQGGTETDTETDTDSDTDTDTDTDTDRDTDSDDTGAGPIRYELRVVSSAITADGWSKVPVLALGTHADGSPADDDVVFGTSRFDAGMFDPASTTLAALGSTAHFTACDSTTKGCTGPVDLTLALASDPATAVAQVSVDLVEPDGVGDPAECLIGGNVLFADGEGWVYDGTVVVTEADWDTIGERLGGRIAFRVEPYDADVEYWSLEFSTFQLKKAISVGVYEDAQRVVDAKSGHPGIDIFQTGRSCANLITGRFEIHEVVWDGDDLSRFTLTFQQYCNHETIPLNGCIHYEAP